jgi:hypothetical protein
MYCNPKRGCNPLFGTCGAPSVDNGTGEPSAAAVGILLWTHPLHGSLMCVRRGMCLHSLHFSNCLSCVALQEIVLEGPRVKASSLVDAQGLSNSPCGVAGRVTHTVLARHRKFEAQDLLEHWLQLARQHWTMNSIQDSTRLSLLCKFLGEFSKGGHTNRPPSRVTIVSETTRGDRRVRQRACPRVSINGHMGVHWYFMTFTKIAVGWCNRNC